MNNNLQKFYTGIFIGTIGFILFYIVLYITYPLHKNKFNDYGELANKGVSSYPRILSSYQNAFIKNHSNPVFLYGTSESGGLATRPAKENYWRLLNRYYNNQVNFSSFGGAGNTPLMWAINLLHLPENSIVYYVVNPIYFTTSLNSYQSIQRYSKRYLTQNSFQEIVQYVNSNIQEDNINAFMMSLNLPVLPENSTQKEISFFLHEAYNNLTSISQEKNAYTPLSLEELDSVIVDADINKQFNVSEWILKERDYSTQGSIKIVPDFTNSPRFLELMLIQKIAELKNINLNYIILPTNEIFFTEHGATYPQQFKEIIPILTANLCKKDNCINFPEHVQDKNIFLDAMHLNYFGAVTITKEIIRHLDNIRGKND